MTARRTILLVILTAVAGMGAFYLFGLAQFGDCYPEEPRLSRCLADKTRDGRVALGIAALAYVTALWLILRRWKETDVR